MRKIIFIAWIVPAIILFINQDCSAGINEATEYFLCGDFKSSISECEDIISFSSNQPELEQAHLLLALSQLKTGDPQKAKYCLDALLSKYPNSKTTLRANLALADTYFSQEDFSQSIKINSEMLKSYPKTDLRSVIYFKLGQANLKSGNWQSARYYFNKVKEEFPLSVASDLAGRLANFENYFTLQIGSFKDKSKAKSFSAELVSKGYPAYITEVTVDNDIYYRVRVGKLLSRKEVTMLKDELSAQGYPSFIFP